MVSYLIIKGANRYIFHSMFSNYKVYLFKSAHLSKNQINGFVSTNQKLKNLKNPVYNFESGLIALAPLSL